MLIWIVVDVYENTRLPDSWKYSSTLKQFKRNPFYGGCNFIANSHFPSEKLIYSHFEKLKTTITKYMKPLEKPNLNQFIIATSIYFEYVAFPWHLIRFISDFVTKVDALQFAGSHCTIAEGAR